MRPLVADVHALRSQIARIASKAPKADTVVCHECMDATWVVVDSEWVNRAIPMPNPPTVDANERQVDTYMWKSVHAEQLREQMADAVRPCSKCRPEQYERWRQEGLT